MTRIQDTRTRRSRGRTRARFLRRLLRRCGFELERRALGRPPLTAGPQLAQPHVELPERRQPAGPQRDGARLIFPRVGQREVGVDPDERGLRPGRPDLLQQVLGQPPDLARGGEVILTRPCMFSIENHEGNINLYRVVRQWLHCRGLRRTVVTFPPAPTSSTATRSGCALAGGESVIKCPSPLNVLKYIYDHSCYSARSDEYQHLMTDLPVASPGTAIC